MRARNTYAGVIWTHQPTEKLGACHARYAELCGSAQLGVIGVDCGGVYDCGRVGRYVVGGVSVIDGYPRILERFCYSAARAVASCDGSAALPCYHGERGHAYPAYADEMQLLSMEVYCCELCF